MDHVLNVNPQPPPKPAAWRYYSHVIYHSCLAILPDGTIANLYEAGDKRAYENIVFTRFNLDWLTTSKAP